jgi:hypothetical protein
MAAGPAFRAAPTDLAGRQMSGSTQQIFPNIPIQGGGADTLISQFAVGQTLTAHDVPGIGDFTYYLSTVVDSPLSDGGQTSVTLTPGIRTHLGQDWYFLAGLPTPLTKARCRSRYDLLVHEGVVS